MVLTFSRLCGRMDEGEELSQLRNEVYGKCRFDEWRVVNVTRDECFASVKNLGRFLRKAMEHRNNSFMICVFLCLCYVMSII